MTLHFLNFNTEVDIADVKQMILEINNELTMPMKILKFNKEKGATNWRYYIEVEECLDPKEWERLRNIYALGWTAARRLIEKSR